MADHLSATEDDLDFDTLVRFVAARRAVELRERAERQRRAALRALAHVTVKPSSRAEDDLRALAAVLRFRATERDLLALLPPGET